MTRIGGANLIMLTTIATSGARFSAAADWSNTLEAAINAAYVTNPALVVGSSVTDESAQVSVDGNTTAQTERGQLTVVPRFFALRYAHETDLDFNEGSLELTYLEKLERGQWTFDAQGLADSTVTSELGTTGITYVNRRHTVGTVSLSYQHNSTERLAWQVQAGGQLTRYTDAAEFGLVDYNYGSVLFGPIWNFSERVQGSLTLVADRLTPHGATSQNDYSANLQLKRSFSEQYDWRVSVGGTRTDYGSSTYGSAASQTTSVYELGTTRKGERVQWDVSIKRAVLPIGIGLLAPQTVATLAVAVGTSERSSLNFTLNGIRTDSVLIDQYVVYHGGRWVQAGAEWRYRFSPQWALSVAGILARARYTSDGDWAHSNQARLGIIWNSGRL